MVRDSEAKHRRLAAVVFTDIVGFSALVNRDEALGARALSLQRRVVRRLVPAFRGREIETAGDSFLLIFGSAFAALRCIAAIQQQLALECAERPVDPPVLLRASLHLGDIEHRGREIFGDGVNIAARLLPMSSPGGMAMSDQVHSQIRHRLNVVAQSIGPCNLKNIRYPVEVFLLDAEAVASIPSERAATPRRADDGDRSRATWTQRWAIAAALLAVLGVSTLAYQALSTGHAAHLETARLGTAANPSTIDLRHRTIAVLPFAALSSGADDALLATGIQDSVLTNLARVDDLRVISRTSVMQYGDKAVRNLRDIGRELGAGVIVEGSLQRLAGKLLVQVQMIDAVTDQHLWAQSYERKFDDLFEVESNIAQQVAEAAQVKLTDSVQIAMASKPTTNVAAYTDYLQAEKLIDSRDPSKLGEAESLLRQSLELDPRFALAHTELSYLALSAYFSAKQRTEEQLWKVRDELIKAGDLQPGLPELHRGWGNYYFYGRGDSDSAIAEFEEAVKLEPNDPRTLRSVSGIYVQQGRLDQAKLYQRRVIELDPLAPASYFELIGTLWYLHDYDGVKQLLDRAEQIDPKNPGIGKGRVALALIANGNVAEARRLFGESDDHYDAEKLAYFAGDLDEAIRQIKLQPEWQSHQAGEAPYPTRASIAVDLWIKGDRPAAEAKFREVIPMLEAAIQSKDVRQWDQRGTLAMAYAATGSGDKALEQIRLIRATDATSNPVSRGDALWEIAMCRLMLGDRAGALGALAEMLAKPSDHSLLETRIDPAWRSLRDDPQFRTLSEFRPADEVRPAEQARISGRDLALAR